MRVPLAVGLLATIDLTLAGVYLGDSLAGQPFGGDLSSFIDLNGEENLPTWYSSVRWFFVGVLTGLFAWRHFNFFKVRSWLLLALPAVFLALSLDEVAQIHEWLGRQSDALLPGGSRANTPFRRTGIWMFLLGLPFLAGFGALLYSMRGYFLRAPGAFAKILLGMGVMLAGSIAIETLQNFAAPASVFATLQVFAEELCEMLGATVVLWGSFELLRNEGMLPRLERAETERLKVFVPARAQATSGG